MKLSVKLLLSFVLGLSIFASSQVLANDEELVCYYQENESGELEYVCINPYEANPCLIGCIPPCQKPDGD